MRSEANLPTLQAPSVVTAQPVRSLPSGWRWRRWAGNCCGTGGRGLRPWASCPNLPDTRFNTREQETRRCRQPRPGADPATLSAVCVSAVPGGADRAEPGLKADVTLL